MRLPAIPHSSGEGGKDDFVFLVGLLHACGAEVFEDDGGEVGCGGTGGFFARVDQFVVFVYGEHAVGGEAFDGEGASHTDDRFILVGFIVEKFLVGFSGDRSVDFLLSGDPL